MKKVIIILSVFSFLIFNSISGQGWQKTYEIDSNPSFGYTVTPTLDGGYLLIGEKSVSRSVFLQVIKTDFEGNFQWTKEHPLNEILLTYRTTKKIIPISGNRYAVFGISADPANRNTRVQFMVIDQFGDLVNSQTYSPEIHTFFIDAVEIPSGGFYVLSEGGNKIGSVGDRSYDLYLSQIDEQGNELWQKRYVNPKNEIGTSLLQSDTNLFLVGNRELSGTTCETFIKKTDFSGNEIEEFTFNQDQIIYAAILNRDQSEIYLTGTHNEHIFGTKRPLWMKVDLAGNLIALEDYAGFGTSEGIAIVETRDGNFGLLSNTRFSTNQKGEINFLIVSPEGNFLKSKTINHILGLEGRDIMTTSDGGFIISGYSKIDDINAWDSYRSMLLKLDKNGNLLPNIVKGKVFYDTDSDCTYSPNDIAGQNIIISGQNIFNEHSVTDENGVFNLAAPNDTFLVNINNLNPIWQPCYDSVEVQFSGVNDTINVDFPLIATSQCPYLKVQLSTTRIRRCRPNATFVHYCNEGSVKAENVFIEITIDPKLSMESSSIPWSQISGNTYTFEVGDLDIFECEKFQFTTFADCDSVQIGESVCLEAHIFPDSLCIPLDSLWDGSDLVAKANCDGDSVRFEIKNNGQQMQSNVDFIIIEDDMVMRQGNIQAMPAQGISRLSVPADGSTFRIEVSQSDGHPWSNQISSSNEGCGTNVIGQFSKGFVTMFPLSDNAPFVDQECLVVRDSYDPNDKQGFPRGVCSRRFIFNYTPLDYKIRFQNTGNDTAYRVEIRDTISEFLDISTVQIVNSSHAYTWNIASNQVLVFSFDDINLPDSTANQALSNGFIQYKIKQKGDNMIDAEILNKAAIYFDFNAPVITNEVLHTVGDDFLTRELGDLMISGNVSRENGTPIDSAIVFLSDNCITYTNSNGDYLFENIESGEDYMVQVRKEEDHKAGVDILDLFALSRHILNIDTTFSFYQIFSADVNITGSSTTLDMLALKKLILGLSDRFPNIDFPWWFFDSKSTQDLSASTQIEIQNLTSDSHSNNFVGAKKGDLVSETDFEKSPFLTEFKIDSIHVCGEQFTLPVSFENTDTIIAFQFSLKFDNQVLSIKSIDGINETCWFEKDGIIKIANFGKSPMELVFEVKGNIGSSTEITLTNDLKPYFLAKDLKITPFKFTPGFVKINSLDPIEIFYTATHPTTGSSMDGQIDITNVIGGSGQSGTMNFEWSNGETTPLITGLNSGSYTVTITDPSGCQLDSTIVLSGTSSAQSLSFDAKNLYISPNPTTETNSFLTINNSKFQNIRLQIQESSGKAIYSKDLEITRQNNQIPLPEKLPSGMYFVKILFEKEGYTTLKWLVQ